jgi:transposase
MSIYAGLDVSDKTTHVCLVDSEGEVLRRDIVASDPEVLARWFEKYGPAFLLDTPFTNHR